MLNRQLHPRLLEALRSMPVVALLGARQVGKTTLALEVAERDLNKEVAYLDLELDSDLAKLNDAEAFLRQFKNKLLIIDEVQQKPELFRVLRGLVDIRKRAGEKTGQFLLLGSASRDLLHQSSESLAGRIRFLELHPFTIPEVREASDGPFSPEQLWYRGGFPDSFLAPNNKESWNWRSDFITTYVERDIPMLGVNISSTNMRRFWTMVSHLHGQQVNFSNLGKSLDVSHTTIRNYLDLFTDVYMLRQVQPWSGNTKKRLVKAPKIYVRDTGLLHRLLGIAKYDDLLGHPIVGHSWEGFIVENIVGYLPDDWTYSYYRTATGNEIDLVLEKSTGETWAIEIKRTIAPKLKATFHNACADIKATRKFVIYNGTDRFPMTGKTEAIGIAEFLEILYGF